MPISVWGNISIFGKQSRALPLSTAYISLLMLPCVRCLAMTQPLNQVMLPTIVLDYQTSYKHYASLLKSITFYLLKGEKRNRTAIVSIILHIKLRFHVFQANSHIQSSFDTKKDTKETCVIFPLLPSMMLFAPTKSNLYSGIQLQQFAKQENTF